MAGTTEATARTSRFDRLPFGVYLLGFSLFAMGSAEFLLAGVLPAVAADLGVPLSSAGFLITAFALGVVVGGPPFAVLSLRWPGRTALLATQGVFAASIVVGLLGNYHVFLLTRVVSGLAYAGFFAVASVTAIGMVTPDRNARASGIVVSGLSVAMVVGGPAGTLLSHFTQWRGGFWAIVALTAVGILGCRLGLPAPNSHPTPTTTTTSSGTRELATMRRPLLWNVYAITVLTTAAYMITFNYLAAMLTEITALPEVWIPAMLALFGVGAFLGLSIGGRISDRRPHLALLTGVSAIAVLSVVMAATIRQVGVVVPTVFLLGIAAFVVNPAIYGRVFAIAAGAPTLAGATAVSAFQLGISITPALAASRSAEESRSPPSAWSGPGLPVRRCRSFSSTGPVRPARRYRATAETAPFAASRSSAPLSRRPRSLELGQALQTRLEPGPAGGPFRPQRPSTSRSLNPTSIAHSRSGASGHGRGSQNPVAPITRPDARST